MYDVLDVKADERQRVSEVNVMVIKSRAS